MTAAVAARPLSSTEAADLHDLERTISRGLAIFTDVGQALAAVRDRRLYRATHDTFEAYCAEQWGFTDRRARQMIDAATTVANLPTGTTVPVTESQARELAGLDPETAAAVMNEAAPPGERTTAAGIRDARARVTETERTSTAVKTEYDVDTETGEIAPPADPISQAVNAVRTGPVYVAGKELERIFTAVRGIDQVGGPAAVADDLDESEIDAQVAADLVDTLDRVIPVLTDLRGRLSRRNLRSVQ